MDSLITAAAHALASGDPLGALKRIALRDDPASLALRGAAMAQLGDLRRAKALLRMARQAYGPREALACARCVVAETEIDLASRDLSSPPASLLAARAVLEAHGDHLNAAHTRYLEIRRLLLMGRLDAAEELLALLAPRALPPALRATHELMVAGIAVRRVRAGSARIALARASDAADRAGIPALMAEVDTALRALNAPAGRLITHAEDRVLCLDEVETLFASAVLVVDACSFSVRSMGVKIGLARRPVLFNLARLLAATWPADVPRELLVIRIFRAKRVDATYRARLRVEIGRLRRALAPVAYIDATRQGFAMRPRGASAIAVLARPVEDEHTPLLALLADGESWSSSSLALALGTGPRTVQRALQSLTQQGKVHASGHGRARRWTAPALGGFTTALLLPVCILNP